MVGRVKRGMVGGAHRGPVGVDRQRRTIRLVQIILVILAAGLLMFAGYSLGRARGFDDGRDADELSAPRRPTTAQTVVLAVLGVGALGAAVALQAPGGVRLLTPAKLLEMEESGTAGPVHLADADEPDEPARTTGT
jgi:hypothetical protein